MLLRGRIGAGQITVSLKPSSISSAIDHSYVVAWDLGGRLYTVWRHGQTYRRGLDGRVLHKWRDMEAAPDAEGPYDERQRVLLTAPEAGPLLDEAAGHAREVAEAISRNPGAWMAPQGGQPQVTDGLREAAIHLLQQCARFDAARAAEDAARFATVYTPIGILPPDQYMSLVLQATQGCSFGTCTFCDLYQDGYLVKSPDEFERHIEAVLSYLGASRDLRSRAIFLGSANALAVPMSRLSGVFDAIRRAFPTPLPVHAFVDGFTGVRKTEDDYRVLGARGLRRVYVGLESGHDPLLAFARKPATSAEAVETVRHVKAAGLSAGVIVMTGLGGHQFAAGHVADTVSALNAMPLDGSDLLYFSELVQAEGTDYPRLSHDHGIEPLDLPALHEQRRAILDGLRFAAAPPRVARYDVREFVY